MPRFQSVFAFVLALVLLASPVWAENMVAKPGATPVAAKPAPTPAAAPAPVSTAAPAAPVTPAAPADPYTVNGVDVDIKASATEARDKAFNEGGKKALGMLINKGAPSSKYDPTKMSDADISNLVKSFEVEKERASSGRYIATLTFHFRPGATQAFLGSRGISLNMAADGTSISGPDTNGDLTAIKPVDTVLVLPVLKIGDLQAIMWEQPTSWQRAWANYLSDSGAADLVMADGTMEDVRMIGVGDALAGTRAAIARIAGAYHAKMVLVPILQSPTVVPNSGNDLFISITRYDFAGVALNTYAVPLRADKNARVMEWLQGGVASVVNAMRSLPKPTPAAVAQQNPSDEEVQNGMAAATSSVAGQMPGAMPMTPSSTRLTITVPFNHDNDWSNASAVVESITGVTNFEPVSLTHERAVVQLGFDGTRLQLDQALKDHGYQLVQPQDPRAMPTLLPLGAVLVPTQMGPQTISRPVPAIVAPPVEEAPLENDTGDGQ